MYAFTHLNRGIRAALLVVAMLVAAPTMVVAQEGTPEVSDDQRMIIVQGTGVVDVTPDTADVTFGVLTQNESLEAAQNDASTRIQAVRDVLAGAEIADEDIATSEYTVRVINEFDDDGNFVGVQGYEVRTGLTVTIRDISRVGAVLDQAVGAGANEVSSIRFYVENTDEAASQARTQAIDNARAKADQMAEASGVIVTGVFLVEEVSSPQPPSVEYQPTQQELEAASGDAAPREVPVSPGQASITVKVRVVFEIEQPRG